MKQRRDSKAEERGNLGVGLLEKWHSCQLRVKLLHIWLRGRVCAFRIQMVPGFFARAFIVVFQCWHKRKLHRCKQTERLLQIAGKPCQHPESFARVTTTLMPLVTCTEIGGICGSFPSPEARRDEGLNLPGPVVLGYIRQRPSCGKT